VQSSADLTRALTEAQTEMALAAQTMRKCHDDTAADQEMAGDVKEVYEKAKTAMEAQALRTTTIKNKLAEVKQLDALLDEHTRPAPTADPDEATPPGHVPNASADRFLTHKGFSPYERHAVRPARKEVHNGAFGAYIRAGEVHAHNYLHKNATKAEQHALMTTTGTLGGFLVPPDFRAELLMQVSAVAIFMRLARRIPTSTNEASWPVMTGASSNGRLYKSGFTGTWRAEGATGTTGTAPTVQNQPAWGQKTIPMHAWEPDAVVLTPEQIEDQAINAEAILQTLIAETLALDVDSECLTGVGLTGPRGILAGAGSTGRVQRVQATAAANVDYGGWIDLVYGTAGLPAQYHKGAVILMAPSVYGETLKLEDTEGSPIINTFTNPDKLWQFPIEFSEFMPAVAEDGNAAIIGNFQNYGLAERTDLRVQRLFEKYAPNTGFLARARFGGDTLVESAFKILQCGAP